MESKSDNPDISWSLSRLASFGRELIRRTAIDGWLLGKVLILARDRLKAERRWLVWVKKEFKRSKSWAYQQIDLHKELSLEEVQHLPLTKAYKLADAARAAQRPKKARTAQQKGKTNFSWAVDDEEYEIAHDYKQASDAGDEFVKIVRAIDYGALTSKARRKWEDKLRATIDALDDELVRLIRVDKKGA